MSAELQSLKERKRSELQALQKRTDKLIETLERLEKRATRRFSAARSKQELAMLSREWRAHIRWIRFNLAYFKPFRPVSPDYRRMQWRRIDKLVKMAKQEVERRGRESPNERELRRIARAFMRSCKQGYQGDLHFIYMLNNTEDPEAQRRLFAFFEPRIGGKL
jgi:hypothetical protein